MTPSYDDLADKHSADDRATRGVNIPPDQFTVYLIRHAQPIQAASLRYDVPPGPPLSADGQRQALMVASFLHNHPPLVIYTSPLDRALQTAQIIAAQLGAPLALDERIAEHRREETDEQVIARVIEFWRQRVSNAAPRCIALVSHGSPIRAMLAALGDVLVTNPEHYRFDAGNIAPHAGVWRARRRATVPSAGWELALIFRTFALNTCPQWQW